MTPAPSRAHPELASEQAYIEKVEAAFQRSREQAKGAAGSAGDRFAARNIREHMLSKRLSEPVDQDALVFGRIDFEDGRRYYLGRGAVHDNSELLVINWRRPIAAPFYEAQRAH